MNFKIEAGWHVPLYETRFKKLRKKTGHIYEAMRHVKKFRLGLDIGANVGIMSSIMSEKFESVMAFECVPDTLECLNYNMKSFPNVKTFPFAISTTSIHSDGVGPRFLLKKSVGGYFGASS